MNPSTTQAPAPGAQVDVAEELVVALDGYVPVIDISHARSGDPEWRRRTAEVIDETCRSSGFLVITGHGVDQDLIDRMHEVSLRFFELEAEVKEEYEAVAGDPTIRGFFHTPSYVAAGDGTETAPDLCELFTICRLGEPGVATTASLGDDFEVWSRPNPWPTLPDFKHTWLQYYAALEDLSSDLMQLFALALGLDEDFFDDAIDDHVTNLVANHYPPVDEEPLPGQYRKGPHSDWGTFTVLYQDDTGGLEVLDRANDEWLDVPVVPGSFVVNIGDLMAVWTNDRWRSTKHRVRVPSAERRQTPRVSIPFFHQPNWDAEVECLPSCLPENGSPTHESVTSGAYLVGKINAAYN